MWPCHPSLLQAIPPVLAELSNTKALGTVWADESGTAGEGRGGAGDAAGAGVESGACCADHT